MVERASNEILEYKCLLVADPPDKGECAPVVR
jgi:hypothetical protein